MLCVKGKTKAVSHSGLQEEPLYIYSLVWNCFRGTVRDTQKSEMPFSNTLAVISKYVPHEIHNSSITTQLQSVWLTPDFL